MISLSGAIFAMTYSGCSRIDRPTRGYLNHLALGRRVLTCVDPCLLVVRTTRGVTRASRLLNVKMLSTHPGLSAYDDEIFAQFVFLSSFRSILSQRGRISYLLSLGPH